MPAWAAGILFFGSILVFGLADFFLVFDKKPGNTWSEVTRAWAERALIIPWVFGVLSGHWFHFFSEGRAFKPMHMVGLAILTGVVVASGALISRFVQPFPNWILYVYLQAGIHAGVFLWRV